MCSKTWKAWVTERRQDALRRAKSALHTGDVAGSFLAWPTATAVHADRGNHDEPIEKYLSRVRDYEEGRSKGKPGKSLGVAVRMEWPTATSRDWKDSPGMSFEREGRGSEGRVDLLPRMVYRDGRLHRDANSKDGNPLGLLNPAFVECLMGYEFEPGWTDLEHWVTQSSTAA